MSQTGKCTKCGKMGPIRTGSGGRCLTCQPIRYERIITGVVHQLLDEDIVIRSGNVDIKYPLHAFAFGREWVRNNFGKHITLIVNTALEVDDE